MTGRRARLPSTEVGGHGAPFMQALSGLAAEALICEDRCSCGSSVFNQYFISVVLKCFNRNDHGDVTLGWRARRPGLLDTSLAYLKWYFPTETWRMCTDLPYY
jgi:hypothetical protein